MYQRYAPKPGAQPPKQGKPPAGEMNAVRQNKKAQGGTINNNRHYQQCNKQRQMQRVAPVKEEKKQKISSNPVLGLLPSSVYNPKTKKVLGFFTAEDLLLAGLIFMLLDSEETEDSILVYLLLYVLLSEYIELPF